MKTHTHTKTKESNHMESQGGAVKQPHPPQIVQDLLQAVVQERQNVPHDSFRRRQAAIDADG